MSCFCGAEDCPICSPHNFITFDGKKTYIEEIERFLDTCDCGNKPEIQSDAKGHVAYCAKCNKHTEPIRDIEECVEAWNRGEIDVE